MEKRIALEKLADLWPRLAVLGKLYLPVQDGPAVIFQPWQEDAVVDLQAASWANSPKELFLPREETYLHYQCRGEQINFYEPVSVEPVIAFGIHPCDWRAIAMLDQVFLNRDPVDQLYRQRRETTTVVALVCSDPDPFCFCRSFKIDPQSAPGADLIAELGEGYLYLSSQTAQGEKLLETIADLLEPGVPLPNSCAVETAEFGLQLDGLPEILKDNFEHPLWDQLFRSCLGCGVCTYVCPTCYCFDLEDYGHETAGERFRCWDSCMFKEFTLMAGGHNPRPGRKERVRQRFMHKLQYHPATYGEIACVGCGRCLRSCPVSLDIVQVIKAFGGELLG